MEAISVGPWGCEEGTPFSHRINNGRIQKLVLIHEGGFKSLGIKNATETLPASSTKNHQPQNLIRNSDFCHTIAPWGRRTADCIAELISSSTGVDNENYVVVSKRKNSYETIAQDITGQVCVGGVYQVVANVSVKGGNGQEFEMSATVKIENFDNSSTYLHIGSVFVKDQEWKKLECWFHINRVPKRATFFIEGPPPNIDLCIRHVSILPSTRRYVIKLDPDEYFTGITGYYKQIQKDKLEVISSLTFLSNRTKYGPYGPEEGTPFSCKLTNGEITGFHGTSGTYLNSIGCHVKPFGSLMPDVKLKKVHLWHSAIAHSSW